MVGGQLQRALGRQHGKAEQHPWLVFCPSQASLLTPGSLPLCTLQDVRRVHVWPGHLIRLARERPGLHIDIDAEEAWYAQQANMAAWLQAGPPPPDVA